MKIDGGNLAGEALDVNHAGWIKVDGFEMGVSRTSGGGSDRTGAAVADFRSLQIVKGMDMSTPGLFLSAANGAVYPTATLDVCMTGTADGKSLCFFQIGMKNVSVGSMGTSASSAGDRP